MRHHKQILLNNVDDSTASSIENNAETDKGLHFKFIEIKYIFIFLFTDVSYNKIVFVYCIYFRSNYVSFK